MGLDQDRYWARSLVAPYDVPQLLRPGSVYSNRLMNLHTATRLLLMKIEGEELMGRSTRALKAELHDKERETRAFRAYLLACSSLLRRVPGPGEPSGAR